MDKLIPVHDKIVIRLKKRKQTEVSDGGVIIPDLIADGASLMEATVISVSEQTGDLIPIVCKVGDRILLPKKCMAHQHILNNEPFLIVSQMEIVSIIKSDINPKTIAIRKKG
jgi:co-chaperonin GroES (HSP10)